MKINLKNTSYPKPLLSNLTDDYIDNEFNLEIKQIYDKSNQKLTLKIDVHINNEYINKLIKLGKVYIILHLEQKTQRELKLLNLDEVNEKIIDLFNYSTTEPIEVIGILYCKEDFILEDKNCLNNIYSLLDDNIKYERGDIIGYSNELDINLPEDKRIGSIFDVIPDKENSLNGQPLKVFLDSSSDLIRILMDEMLHKKYVELYKTDQYTKRMMWFSIVEPAIVSAYTEMFNSYDVYKERKWCRTLALKIEKNLKKPANEIFQSTNYDLSKVYEYTNIALGDLFKDAIRILASGMEE